MGKKIIDKIIDVVMYYLSALLVLFIFKAAGWIDVDLTFYALGMTAGCVIAQMIIKFVKKIRNRRKSSEN